MLKLFRKTKESSKVKQQEESYKQRELKRQKRIRAIKKQSEISAREVIRDIQESLDHGFMTYPELIRILEENLIKAKREIQIFRP